MQRSTQSDKRGGNKLSQSEKIILKIKGLRLEGVRAGNVIVDDVDVTLHAGEVLGLIGESGAGKSTIGLSAMSYARAGRSGAGASPTSRNPRRRRSTRRTPSWTRSVKHP